MPRDIGDGDGAVGERGGAIALVLVESGALEGSGARAGVTGDRLTAAADAAEAVAAAEAGTVDSEGARVMAMSLAPRPVALPADFDAPSAAADVDSELSQPSGATGSTNAAGAAAPARSKAGRFEYASAVAAMFAAAASARRVVGLPVAGGRHTVGR